MGNRTSNTDLTGTATQTTTYGYDLANRNAWLAEPGTTSCPVISTGPSAPTAGCVLFLYDDAGRRIDSYLPNGRDNHVDYDSNGRPSYLDNRAYAANTYPTVAGRSYAYTSGPKVAGQNTAGGMVLATGTVSGVYNAYYSYDGMNHVRDQGGAANPTDSNAGAYWHYDANGNRTQATTTGTGATTTYATYNDANQLCWTGPTGGAGITCGAPTTGSAGYTYDPAGNLTGSGPVGGTADHSYGYSSYDQLVSSVVGAVTTGYGYDDVTSDERTQAGTDTITNGLNGTTFVTESATKVQYLRDPAGTLVEIRTKTSSNPWVPQYFTLDRLGSVIALTDSTGLTTAAPTYDPWGVTTSPAPTNPTAAANRYGYASGYTDPGTGLIKYGTRYYAPLLGVWTQADPASQGANYYIYAGDNPITNTDPTGRCSFWGCLGEAAADVGIGVAAVAGTATVCAFTAGLCVAAGVGLGAAGGVGTGLVNGDSGGDLPRDGIVGGALGGFGAGAFGDSVGSYASRYGYDGTHEW